MSNMAVEQSDNIFRRLNPKTLNVRGRWIVGALVPHRFIALRQRVSNRNYRLVLGDADDLLDRDARLSAIAEDVTKHDDVERIVRKFHLVHVANLYNGRIAEQVDHGDVRQAEACAE